MIYHYDTNKFRDLMEEKHSLDAELSRQTRIIAGAHETAIRQLTELSKAVDRAIERLQAGEPDAAYAILCDAVLHV